MQLRFRHRPLEPKQKPVVEIARVVHAVGVADEGVEHGTDLEQLVPVSARARQARHLHAEYEADMAEPDLGDEALEAGTAFNGRARASLVVVDNNDGLARPAELDGALGQGILQPGRLPVVFNLLHRGLADVDHRRPCAVAAVDLVHCTEAGWESGLHHRPSPWSQECFEPFAG